VASVHVLARVDVPGRGLGAQLLGSVVTISVKGVQGQRQQGQGKSKDMVVRH
jgi:hypothetical protein